MSCNDKSDMRQVNVRVKVVNKTERYWAIFAVARRDEARCTVVKATRGPNVQGVTGFHKSRYVAVEALIDQGVRLVPCKNF